MEQKKQIDYTHLRHLKKSIDLEERLEEKVNCVNSFSNSIINIKEIINYSKDENNKSKEKSKKYKTLTTKLQSFDTIVTIATTTSFITLSLTGIGLIAIPISTATACGLLIDNNVIYGIVMQKQNNYKKKYEKDQQTIVSFDKVYKKSLEDNICVKREYDALCNFLTKNFDGTRNETFFKM